MTDTDVRALRRAALGSRDGSSWLRLCHALERCADWDGAAQAALVAAGDIDVSDVLDRLTPTLDLFSAESRELEVLPTACAWTPEGTGLVGLVDRPASSFDRIRPSIEEVCLQTGAARRIVGPDRELVLYHGHTHPVLHPAGNYLAFGYADGPGAHAVATAERATGHVVASMARSRDGLQGLALSGANVLACREAFRTRIYQLGPAGTSTRDRARRVLRWPELSLADGGAFVRRHDQRVDLHDPGAERPRGSVPTILHEHVLPVGRRLVLVDHARVRLHDARGELLAEAPRLADFLGVPTPSPSGRLLAFPYRAAVADQEPRVELLDLRSGATRVFPLREDPYRCVWSPSGRKLLVCVGGPSVELLVAS